ncbi:hypothetical protein C8J56DRAFT_1046075 [Mycena floridula]|nr:hypothetical protein C8J56DRAFT_1046075 [Mycena floridula]
MSDSAAGPLSAEDVSTLQGFVAQIISQFIVFGMHITLALIGIYLLIFIHHHHVGSPRARISLIALTLIMFSAALIGNVITMKAVSTYIASLGPNPPVFDLNYARGSTIAVDSLLRLNWILSDAVVVWRAWALWPKHRPIQIILIVCMLASIATVTADMARISLSFFGKGPQVGSGPFRLLLTLAPLITNITATVLMSVRAWQYRRNVSTPGLTKNGLVEKTLFFLVESGFVYCIIWIVFMSTEISSTVPAENISGIMSGMYISLAGMYPTIVIIIVAMEKSCADTISELSNTSLQDQQHPLSPYRSPSQGHSGTLINVDSVLDLATSSGQNHRKEVYEV